MLSSCGDRHDRSVASAGGLVMGSLDDGDESLGPSEVARVLGVTPKTVSRWAESGWLTGFITLSGHRRFRREYIEELAEQRTRKKDERS